MYTRHGIAVAAILATTHWLSGCATPPATPAQFPYDSAARAETARLCESAGRIAGGWGNLGRYNAACNGLANCGLAGNVHTEMIDWFTLQRNIVAELPGSTNLIVYIVAHYDKTDCNPLALASLLLNGSLDLLTAPITFSRGAKDNATGVATAIELARSLGGRTNRLTYRILLSGSEESGLRGARAHVATLDADERQRVIVAVNIDTVGIAGVSNAVIMFDDYDPLAHAAVSIADDLHMPLDRQKMPLGMLSDYVPFEKTSWWRDMLRGIAFNMPGGFLPQRSWFTGSMGVPVVNFSSLDAMDSGDIIGGLVFLPFGALHGPRDNANGIDAVRLYEQYAIARELLERIDAGTVVPACARAYADGEEMTSQNLRNLRIQTLSSLRGCIHQQACRRGRKWRNGD